MKVYIGPYKNYIGPYQLVNLLRHVGMSNEITLENIEDWLYSTWVGKFFCWIHKIRRNRLMKITIHKYDTWNMDTTLSFIITPMLEQLRNNKHGYVLVDNKDVPKSLRSAAGRDDNEALSIQRWNWVMDEMIFTFDQLRSGGDWEDKFYEDNIDYNELKVNEARMTNGYKNELKAHEARMTSGYKNELKAHEARMTNGYRLFGKYYRSLWD